MADSSLLALPTASSLDGSEYLYVLKAGADGKVRVDQLPNNFLQPSYVPGRWYLPRLRGLVGAGVALPANSIRFIPFEQPVPITVADLALRVTTLAAGGNVQAAIYAADPSTARPTGAALISTGNLSTAAATTVAGSLAASVTLQPGLYFMAVNADASAGGAAILQAMNAASVQAASLVGSGTVGNVLVGAASANLILTLAQTFGTWPDVTASTFVESAATSCGVIALKAA